MADEPENRFVDGGTPRFVDDLTPGATAAKFERKPGDALAELARSVSYAGNVRPDWRSFDPDDEILGDEVDDDE